MCVYSCLQLRELLFNDLLLQVHEVVNDSAFFEQLGYEVESEIRKAPERRISESLMVRILLAVVARFALSLFLFRSNFIISTYSFLMHSYSYTCSLQQRSLLGWHM